VEFLTDTELTQYQQGLVASVETCAKTLLDTLEHILDYAKINKLYNRDRNTRRLETRLKKRDNESSIMGPTADTDLHQLLEEVSEAVCAGHAFRETHSGSGYPSENPKSEQNSNLSHLAVSIEISPKLKYLVRTQPGAIRRIVMNLLGNSLKYTNQGFVAVKMRGKQVHGDPSRVEVVMTFADSGKGMSLEYQKTRMFSPFSQEDPFADGTGLGLSIVRQIVDSLGGHIEIKSTKDVGTTVEVSLVFNVAGEQPDDFAEIRALTNGKAMLLVDGDKCSKNLDACKTAFDSNSKEWFGLNMGILSGNYSDHKADGLLCHESSPNFCKLAVGSIPLMVVCNNQSNQVALRRKLMTTLPPCSRSNVHIVAQPLGPHKLASAFKYMFAERQPCQPPSPGQEHIETAIGMSARDTKAGIDLTQPLYRPAPPMKTHLSETTPKKKVEFELLDRANSEPATQQHPAPHRPIPIRLKSGLSHEMAPATHNVLLVDDNAINLQLLVMFMRKISLPHSSARDGLEALEKYKSCISGNGDTGPSAGGFTYVLMDISMPIMDGLESTRRIRDFEKTTGAKKAIIVALTGLASADAQERALDAGVDYYLPKPVRFADLKRLMAI
jgi:CheY-like chemotaxis protein